MKKRTKTSIFHTLNNKKSRTVDKNHMKGTYNPNVGKMSNASHFRSIQTNRKLIFHTFARAIPIHIHPIPVRFCLCRIKKKSTHAMEQSEITSEQTHCIYSFAIICN